MSLKNSINKVLSIFLAIIGGIICFFLGGLLGMTIVTFFLLIFTIPTKATSLIAGITFIVSDLISGFLIGMHIYYKNREKGYADTHIKN